MSASFVRRSRLLAHALACAVLATSATALAAPTTPAAGAEAKPANFAITPPWAAGKSHKIWQGYGTNLHQYTNRTNGSNDHHALDFDLALGESVHPIAPGTVKYAGDAKGGYSGYGKIVFIDHGNGYQSFYAHLNSVEVQAGQQVNTGTRLGGAGNSGTSAVHLHLVLYRGASFTNTSASAGPHGGVAVVPEVFSSCTKAGGPCEQLGVNAVLTRTDDDGPPDTCPYNSVQSRVHRDVSQPWAQSITLTLGQSFEVAAFYNGSGQLAQAPAFIKVTGPNNFKQKPANLGKVTPPEPGTYNVKAKCGDIVDVATVVVQPGPSNTCPFGSIQARVHRNANHPWAQSISLPLGKSFEVGAFYNGSGQLAPHSFTIKVTGPNSFKEKPANLGKVTPPAAGTYNVKVKCGTLTETATVTVTQ